MTSQTSKDIPLRISSANAASERRITPSWTLFQLKARLEPITGVPPSAQQLVLRDSVQGDITLSAEHEDQAELSTWPLKAYAELYVHDTRPPAARKIDFTDLSSIEKYTMPQESYSALLDSVLAWKKANKLGRFDPDAPEIERQRIASHWSEVEARQILLGNRCRLGADSARRGVVSFVGEVPEIPGPGGPWIGVILDEPMGKNDGSAGGKRYFHCPNKRGIFVRPERVEIGDFGQLIEEDDDEDMEEI